MKAASPMTMLMEDAIALVREHDERSADLTKITLNVGIEVDALPVFEEGTRLRNALRESAKKLLANLTGEDPSEENVEEAIYG